jgi:hypothetical protein
MVNKNKIKKRGNFEWKGKWSDFDKESWTPTMKKKLHYENSDDGQFW